MCRLRNDRWLSRSVRHSALPGRTVARRHITDGRAITLNIVIHEVEEIGGSIARHPHEFGRERGGADTLQSPLAYASVGDARP